LHRAADLVPRYALLFGQGQIHAQKNRCRGVDGHGGGDLVKGDTIEQDLHVLDGVDGHPDLADFTHGKRVVTVVTGLRGQMEGDAQAGLALIQQVAVAFVGLLGGPKTGVLTHGPIAAAIHGRLYPTGVGKHPRIGEIPVVIHPGHIQRGIEPLDGSAGNGGENRFLFLGFGQRLLNRPLVPILLASFDLL